MSNKELNVEDVIGDRPFRALRVKVLLICARELAARKRPRSDC
jgi:hypothetical protein